jgi:hypothetical protein
MKGSMRVIIVLADHAQHAGYLFRRVPVINGYFPKPSDRRPI